MNKFDQSLAEGYVKRIPISTLRAKSLIKSAEEAIATAKDIPLKEGKLKSIFRELYEGLREYCEAMGYLKGYKFQTHEVITHFISDILKEENISKKFDRYRRLRNGINYYGESIAKETVQEALEEIPKIKKELEKYTNSVNQ